MHHSSGAKQLKSDNAVERGEIKRLLEKEDLQNDSIASNNRSKYELPRNGESDHVVVTKSDDRQPSPPKRIDIGMQKKMTHNGEPPMKNNSKQERIECIEIDLSDDSSNDDTTDCKRRFSKVEESSEDNPTLSSTIQSEMTQSPIEKKMSSCKYDRNAIDGSERIEFGNVNDDCFSQSSDSSASLEVMPPSLEVFSKDIAWNGKKVYPNSEVRTDSIRFSFNDDDNVNFTDNDHYPRHVDFSCIRSERFDDNHSEKEKQQAKRKQTSSLKDDLQVLDVDSDDSSNTSTDDVIFTSRPFKVKAAKLAVATETTKSNEQNGLNSASKLATPRAFSPATTSPTMGAYETKRKVSTPAIPAMSESLVKEIGGKLYPDLRHNFVVALTSHARRLRHNSYQRAAFDAALRSIVIIR